MTTMKTTAITAEQRTWAAAFAHQVMDRSAVQGFNKINGTSYPDKEALISEESEGDRLFVFYEDSYRS